MTPRAPDPTPETVNVPSQPTEPNLRIPTGIADLGATLRVDAPSEMAEIARAMRVAPVQGLGAPVARTAGFRARSDSEADRGVPETARMPDAPQPSRAFAS